MKNKPSYEELVNQVAEHKRQNEILKLSENSIYSDRSIQYKAELKFSEEKLNKSEQRFELAMKGATDGLWDWNLENNTVYFSPRTKGILGYSDNEIENNLDSWVKLIHKDDREAATQIVNTFVSGKEENYKFEFRMKHKNGTFRYILSRGFAIRSESGDALRITGTHIDITEFKQKVLDLIEAKGKVKESEARFKALHNTPFSGIAIHDRGIILECNQRLIDITGYSREELIGKNGLKLVNEESRNLVRKNILSGFNKPYEAVGLHKNGNEFPVCLGGRTIP